MSKEDELLRRLRDDLAEVPENPLEDIRRRSGQVQTAVALKADMSQAHVSDLENGRRELTWSAAEKLGAALGVEPEGLIVADTLAALKSTVYEDPGALDARLLADVVRFLEELLPPGGDFDRLLDTLVELAMERLKALQETRASLKSAGSRRGRRDAFGRRRDKPFGGRR